MKVSEFTDVHGPSAVIIARFAFGTLGVGSPPVTVRYISVALVHEYSPMMLKFPFASVVTVFVSSGVAAVPSPAVPTLYSWIVEFVTGCWPPIAIPLLPVAAAAIVLTGDGIEQPASARAAILHTTQTIDRTVFIPLLTSSAPYSL
jgi:hypothetical protein